ncbi:MAG: SPOR domain-containing protein, partial [Proteobacteria bacterium]|nr:SPOR domain-containing protein [Pseudomonadota bacterium]
MPAAPPSAGPSATPSAAATAGYRVQLGAFGDGSGAAQRTWQSLAARYPALGARTPLIAAARNAAGRPIHRLQVAGFDRAGAEALCAELAGHHDPCLVVPPLPGPGREAGPGTPEASGARH